MDFWSFLQIKQQKTIINLALIAVTLADSTLRAWFANSRISSSTTRAHGVIVPVVNYTEFQLRRMDYELSHWPLSCTRFTQPPPAQTDHKDDSAMSAVGAEVKDIAPELIFRLGHCSS